MDREQFIESQVAFQFGACDADTGTNLKDLARSLARGRSAFVLHDPSNESFVPAGRARWLRREPDGEWKPRYDDQDVAKNERHRTTRKADLLNELYEAGLKSPLMMDMADAVSSDNPFPVFQYNRLDSASNAVLWPLKRYHRIGSKSFCIPPDASESDLREKKPMLCWRGVLRGYSTYAGGSKNVGHVIKAFVDGKLDRDLLLAHLQTVPRYAFMSRHFGAEGFDIGFHITEGQRFFAEVPEIARYVKPYAAPAAQLQNKYQISIQGTDVASSFGWQLGTNCAVLREPYPWTVFFDGHFRPWDHYVPVAADFSDVREKMAWCEENQDACRLMIEKRHALVYLLLEPETRREALKRVIARYNSFYAHWSTGI